MSETPTIDTRVEFARCLYGRRRMHDTEVVRAEYARDLERALRGLLLHCDATSNDESNWERAVTYARQTLGCDSTPHPKFKAEP